MYISHFIEKIREMACLYLLHWFIKLFFIKYKDEYQKSKWTIECRIFISFIWSRSELWNRRNNNDFTKKTKIGMTRFRRLYVLFDLKPFHFYRIAATERADTIQDFGRFPIEIKAKIGYLIVYYYLIFIRYNHIIRYLISHLKSIGNRPRKLDLC